MENSVQSHGNNVDLSKSSPTTTQRSQQSLLLLLPLELRREIYKYCIINAFTTRAPDALIRAVYFGNLRDVWVDRPSPLFKVNKQIHFEAADLLQRMHVFLRITSQGMAFDQTGLSACIAHDIDAGFSKNRIFFAEIWPPNPDRPIEMLYIWRHLQRLRDIFSEFSKIEKLTLRFANNKRFKWSHNKPLYGSGYLDNCLMIDMKNLLDLFATLANVEQAAIIFPKGFLSASPDDSSREASFSDYSFGKDADTLRAHNEDNSPDEAASSDDLFREEADIFSAISDNLLEVDADAFRSCTRTKPRPKKYKPLWINDAASLMEYAEYVEDIMMGYEPADNDSSLERLEFEGLEKDFKRLTAKGVLRRLDKATKYGKHKISEMEFDSMVSPWPYFEALTYFEDPRYQGKWHYATKDC